MLKDICLFTRQKNRTTSCKLMIFNLKTLIEYRLKTSAISKNKKYWKCYCKIVTKRIYYIFSMLFTQKSNYTIYKSSKNTIGNPMNIVGNILGEPIHDFVSSIKNCPYSTKPNNITEIKIILFLTYRFIKLLSKVIIWSDKFIF